MADKWIAGATKGAHGQFAAKAKAAGMSTEAFAKKNLQADGKLGKQARLAYTLMGLHGDGKSSMKEGGDKRSIGAKLYQVG